jgi:hypothetical protein
LALGLTFQDELEALLASEVQCHVMHVYSTIELYIVTLAQQDIRLNEVLFSAIELSKQTLYEKIVQTDHIQWIYVLILSKL